MRIRQLTICKFRGIDNLEFQPGQCTVILGPNNAGKSTILEGLDFLLHPGWGRRRPVPDETDYYLRDTSTEFTIEAVVGGLSESFLAEVHHYLEGWRGETSEIVAEPDGDGVEAVVRVRVRGTPDLELLHEFSKPEAEGASFYPTLRDKLGWVFDGRTRDPGRELSFYRGGLLDRLFSEQDLSQALGALQGVLWTGMKEVNKDPAVEPILGDLSTTLRDLGIIDPEDNTALEPRVMSTRSLLQNLRLAFPAIGDVQIPLVHQGRGVQRIVLVSILLKLASATGEHLIGGFEEPEEALEPLRQVQLAEMLRQIAAGGGQLFVVTHSPDIVRCFLIDDILIMQDRGASERARHLPRILSPAVRRGYERHLDGAIVRGLFSRFPVIVEGPSGQAVMEVFLKQLAQTGDIPPYYQMGIDIINAESVSTINQLAGVLHEAGKRVLAWVDQDSDDALREIVRIRRDEHCSCLLLHSDETGNQNLEQALASCCSLEGLAKGMELIASERGFSWDDQKKALISRSGEIDQATRERAKETGNAGQLLGALPEASARLLVKSALDSDNSPFRIKGARPARLLAEAVVDTEGVPEYFRNALRRMVRWIIGGGATRIEIRMDLDA